MTTLNIAAGLKRSSNTLIAIEHHCVLDPSYKKYRSVLQGLYHDTILRANCISGLKAADTVIAVSSYTADSLYQALGGPRARVILNGVETDYFMPASYKEETNSPRRFRLLYVGNMTRRKGADLLPRIMKQLGEDYILYYTSGLRTKHIRHSLSNMRPLGRLTRERLRAEYQKADLLLFPTRFEGFGFAAAEALACGTPVITTRCSSLPEIVIDGTNGKLVEPDDVEGYCNAIRSLANDEELLHTMSINARNIAANDFCIERMGKEYHLLLSEYLS